MDVTSKPKTSVVRIKTEIYEKIMTEKLDINQLLSKSLNLPVTNQLQSVTSVALTEDSYALIWEKIKPRIQNLVALEVSKYSKV